MPRTFNNWPNFPSRPFDHTASFNHLLCQTPLQHVWNMLSTSLLFSASCSFFRSVKNCEKHFTCQCKNFSCWVLPSHLPFNKLSRLTREHKLSRRIPPAACETTHLLSVDIMLWMKLHSYTFICYRERHGASRLNIHCSPFKMLV